MFVFTRPALLKTAMVGFLGFFSLRRQQQLTSSTKSSLKSEIAHAESANHSQAAADWIENTKETVPRRAYYHAPPPGVDYSNNPTVFGKILRGELPAAVVEETADMLVFQDIHPAAPLHDLIIPKRRIATVYDLTAADVPLLLEMHRLALHLLQTQQPAAFESDDYRLVFHIPPFNSVDHLHLHVIAPASQMDRFRQVKYCETEVRWCTRMDTVVARLQAGEAPVPWPRSRVGDFMANLLWKNKD